MPLFPTSLHSAPKPLETVLDTFQQPVAHISLFPAEKLFYVRWHEHLTSDDVIRVSQAGLRWHEQFRPLGLLNDKRGTSGDWSEAMPWVEYEWVPLAQATGLRVFAYVISPDTPFSFASTQLVERVGHQLDMGSFFSMPAAWKWLRRHTMPLLAAVA